MNDKRLSQKELAARLSNAQATVQIGARYEHYKKQTYRVLHLALREEDNEPCVIYKAEYGEQVTFIRPVKNWLETAEVDGRQVKRFTKVGN